MPSFSGWGIPVGLILLGMLFGYAGIYLFSEYRKAFLQDPGVVMSLEVLLRIT